jgi:hypothetical protein
MRVVVIAVRMRRRSSMLGSAIASTTAFACSSTRSICSTRTQNQVEYFYESGLALEPAGSVTADRHVHPVEPLTLRLTVAAPF